MSKRDWCPFIATTGWGLAIILLCVLFSDVVALRPSPRSIDAKAERQHGQAHKDDGKAGATIKAPDAAEYEAYCQGSQNTKDCIVNRRTAEATERQAKYALYGLLLAVPTILLSALGLWLVKRTLDANRKSAEESARSADAAIRSAKAAEHALSALERPYLAIERIEGASIVHPGHGRPAVNYTIVNYGKTPAILRSLNVRLERNPGYPLRLPPLHAKLFYTVIEAGQRLQRPDGFDGFARVEVEGTHESESFLGPLAQSIVFHGSIHYQGMTGAYYSDRFCFRAGRDAEVFHPDGGDEYNYRKTLADPVQQRDGGTDI